jgi:acetyl-CoA acyltransferase
MSEAYIISAVRSPVGLGRPTGALATLSPVELTSRILQEAVKRAGVEPGQIEDVIWGC